MRRREIENFNRSVVLEVGDEVDNSGQFRVSVSVDGKERWSGFFTDKTEPPENAPTDVRNCTCSKQDVHFGHAEGCPLEAALDAAYCRGWREGQSDPDWQVPEHLARVWRRRLQRDEY